MLPKPFHSNPNRLWGSCKKWLARSTLLGSLACLASLAAPPSQAQSQKSAKAEQEAKEQPLTTLKLLTLKMPSVYHNLKRAPATAERNPLENLMRPPLMALAADDTWQCLLCAEPPKLSYGKKKLRHHKMTITLTLRSDLFWNDGKQVSALDVQHAIEHYNAKALAETGQHRIRVYTIKLFPKRPRTISLTFAYQNQNHLPSLAVPLLPAHLKEKFAERKPVLGTRGFAYGPYTQLSVKGNLLWLRPNPYLKTPPNPSFDQIHIAAVNGLAAAQLELSKRDYDAILDFYPAISELAQLAQLPPKDLLTLTGHKQAVIILNLRNPVFAKPVHRRALWRQVKEANLPASLLPPRLGLRADSFAFPSGDGSAFWREGWLRSRPASLDHLAYWADKPLELAIANTPDRVAIAEKVQDALARGGVKLKIKRYKTKYFQNTILRKGRFDTLALVMRESLPRRTFFENFHSRFVPKYPSYKGRNYGSWYDKRVNHWLEAQLYKASAFDALQRKIEGAYLADVPEIPLFFWPKVMVTRGNLSQVPLARHRFSPLLFIEKWRKIEPGPEISVKSQ